jgi:hypothetical protein
MAVELSGINDQRAKAIELAMHIGTEVQEIIIERKMLADKESDTDSLISWWQSLRNTSKVYQMSQWILRLSTQLSKRKRKQRSSSS